MPSGKHHWLPVPAIGASCSQLRWLVEREYGLRPPYGIIHYPKHTYAVDYTPSLESALLDVLSGMRTLERREEVERSHEEPARCSSCGYQFECDQKL